MSKLKFEGHVQHVIAGLRPEERWISASSFAYAFELGSPLGVESMGEMIALGGHVFCKEPVSGTMVSGDRFVTSGALMIPHEAEPAYTANSFPEEGSVAFAGVMHCEWLHGTSISKAPIYGENIFDHRDIYYARAPVEMENVCVAIVGAAADPGEMDVVLYDNPFEKKSRRNMHCHVLVLNREVERIEEVRLNDAKDVLHLFPDSKIGKLLLNVYQVTELVSF